MGIIIKYKKQMKVFALIGVAMAQSSGWATYDDPVGVDAGGDGCDWYYGNEDPCGNWDTDNFSAWDQCCGCFGGDWELGCDDTNWDVDAGGDGCDWYNQDTYDQCGQWDTDTFVASTDCCWCEGGEWW